MKKMITGEVRPSGKDIIPIILSLILFSVLGWFAWDPADIRFCVYIVMMIGLMLSLAIYMTLRWKMWKITLSDDTVVIRGITGHKKQFPRENVRWVLFIPWGSRIFHVQLYDHSTGKKLVKVPCDWKNVILLFHLHHFGPMSQEENSTYNYLQSTHTSH